MNKEQMLEAIFKTAVENGYTDLKLDVLPVQTAELLVGSGYTVVGLLFDHEFAKTIWGKEEMFSGGKYVIEWEADWRANYKEGKNRTDQQAIEIMNSDLEWFRKNGDVLPKYLIMLRKLAVIESNDERIKFVYESLKG